MDEEFESYESLQFIESLHRAFRKYHPVFCAWCREKKGKVTICGISRVEHTSSICPDCEKEFFK